MRNSLKYIILLLVVLAPFSCKKIIQLPPEPRIEFRGISMFDSTDILGNTYLAGILEFYFEDGDGDIGSHSLFPGATGRDTSNLVFYQFNRDGGMYSTIPDDTLYYRIPYIDRVGQNKVLQGTIEITFLYLGFDDQDTIKYDFFLNDRAGNLSNTVSSCDIVFSGEGGCIPDLN